jgi:hypothetical protein
MAKLIYHNLTHLAILFIIVMYRYQYPDISSSLLAQPVVLHITLHEHR